MLLTICLFSVVNTSKPRATRSKMRVSCIKYNKSNLTDSECPLQCAVRIYVSWLYDYHVSCYAVWSWNCICRSIHTLIIILQYKGGTYNGIASVIRDALFTYDWKCATIVGHVVQNYFIDMFLNDVFSSSSMAFLWPKCATGCHINTPNSTPDTHRNMCTSESE